MNGFFGKHKTLFFIVMMLFFVATPAFAGNPVAPIAPSDNIQDPGDTGTAWGGCGPTDSNCYVTITASQWTTSGSNIFYNTGNVGIGDATPSALLTVGSGDAFQVNSSGAIAAATGITSSGTITFSTLGGGGTQCVQINNSGVLTGTGSACGGGGSGITVGTTAITSGTSGRILYNNAGVVGEMTTTGSGTVLALATSPSFTTPSLGVATATSINGLTLTASTGVFSLTNAKTFAVLNSLTLSGTDGSTLNVGAGGTLGTAAYTASSAYEVPLTFSTGLTRTTNTVSVNTSQNIATLSNLTSNGLVRTSGGTGTLSVDTSTYLTSNQSITLSGDISGSGTTAITTAIGAGKVTNTMLAGSIAYSKLSLAGSIVLGDLATQGTATDEFCLTSETGGGALLAWQSCGGGGVSLAAIGSSPNANGATLTGSVLNLEPASASFGGVVTTGTQTFAGAKTFNSDATVNTITVGLGSGAVATTTVLGYQAMSSSLSMNNSVAIGYQSLKNAGQAISVSLVIPGNEYMIQTTGTTNYIAEQGASSNSPGTVFTAATPGTGTGTVSPTEGNNVAIGYQAMLSNTYGTENIAIGGAALTSNTRGFENIAMGNGALYNSTTGSWNTALGGQSLQSVSTGSNNTAVGGSALNAVAGDDNTALGYNAGSNLTAGSNNIFIGSGIQPNISNTASNQLNIGNWIYGDNGRIGIGIANPSSDTVLELHNNATDVAPQLTLSNENTGNSYAQLRLKGTCNISICTVDGYQGWSFGVGNETESYFGLARDFFIYDQAADAIRFTIKDTTGNVGIGDTSPDYLLDVANTGTDGNIFSLTDSDGECLHNPEAGSETVSCSSDARLKTNIVDTTSALSYFSDFQIRDYNIIASGDRTTGVIAQEMLLTHPELVSQDPSGMYSVQLPNQWKVIKAIQELDIQTKSITELIESDDTSFVAHLRAWLANATNHITRIFTGEICLTDTDGTSECLNKTELHGLKQLLNTQSQDVTPPNPTPDPSPAQDPSSDQGSEAGPEVTPPADNNTTP